MGALDRMKSGIRPEQNTARTEQTPARGSALERMKAGGAPQRKEPVQVTAPAPVEKEADTGMSWDKRLANILAGSAKQSAGGWASGVSTLYEAGQKARDTQSQAFVAEQQENLERAKRELSFMLEDNEKAPGAWSQADIDSSRNIIADAERKLAAMGVVTDGQVQQKAATTARDYSAKVMESGAKDVEEAKKGLGAVGQFLVDAGVAGSQLAGDAAVGLATGGGALLPMALRTFGSGAEDAREAGAELDKQLLYGAGSAAIGVAAEKIANVAKPFSKVFGEGVLDNAIAKATGKLGQTAAGKIALSALSEGGEEFVEAILQPVLQRATYDPDAKFDLGDAIYQMAIGMALGGVGGGVDVATSRGGSADAQNTPPNAAAQRTEESGGVDTTRGEVPAEAPADPLVQAMFGQKKTAPEVETEVTVSSGQSAINESNRERNTLAYTLATSIDQVSDMEPVSQLTGREMNEPGKKPSEQIADFFRRLGNKVFRAGLGDVALNDYGVGGMLNHKPLNRAKMVSLAAVPDVIQNGRQVHYDPNWKGRGYPSYIFAAPVTVGNTPVYVAAVVDQRPDNKFYLSEMVDSEGNYVRIEESPSGNSKNGVTDGAGQASGAGVTAGPEGLSSGTSPSAPNVGAEPVAPVSNHTVSQDAVSVKLGAADDIGGGSVGAAAAGFDPYTEAQYEYGTLPSGENPVRSDDVPVSVDGETRVSQSVVTAKGAQVTPDEFVPLLHRETMNGQFSFVPLTNDESVQAAQEYIMKEGWQTARANWTADVRKGKAGDQITAIGALLYNNEVNAGNFQEALDIFSDYQMAVRNSARGLQAARILKTLTPDSRLYLMQRSIDAMMEDLGMEGVKIPDELMESYRNAKTDDETDAAVTAIQGYAAKQIPATLMDKWTALRYVNMLGNFKTQIRNAAGNIGMKFIRAAHNAVAVGLERLANAASDGKTGRTRSLTVDKSLLAAAKADYANVRVQALGGGKYSDNMNWENQFVQGVQDQRRIFSFGPLEAYRKATNWAMNNEHFGDEAFSRSAYARALAGWLKANKITAAQFSDPAWQSKNTATLDRGRQFAIREAQEATFRDQNDFARMVVKIGRPYDDSKSGKFVSTVLQGILPFRMTPANVLVRAEEYSPLGLLNTTVLAAKKARGGDVSGTDIVNSLAKNLTGSALFLLGMALRNAGVLRGGEDEDEKQAAFDDLTGHQNYSLELGDGTSVTLDWLTPMSMPLFMGVQLEDLRTDQNIELKDLEKALTSIADPMLQMSMLQGVSDTLDSLQYSEGNNLVQWAMAASLDYLTQGLTNTLAGQLERIGEAESTMTYADKESAVPAWLQKELGAAARKTPGTDYAQIPYIDAWGRTEEREDALTRAVNSLFNPAYTSKVEVNEVETELQRLYDATGASVFPQRADKSFTVDGEVKHLSAEEYVKYARAKGTQSQQLLNRITQRSDYQSLSDADKADVVSRVYEYANARAKQQVSNYKLSGWVKSAVESGIDIADYIVTGKTYGKVLDSATTGRMVENDLLSMNEWGAMHSALYADGTVKKDELVEYITKSFPEEKRSDVYKAFIGNRNWGNPF